MKKRRIKTITITLDEDERKIITNQKNIDLMNRLLEQADSMVPSPEKIKEIDEYIKNGGYYITADEWDAL